MAIMKFTGERTSANGETSRVYTCPDCGMEFYTDKTMLHLPKCGCDGNHTLGDAARAFIDRVVKEHQITNVEQFYIQEVKALAIACDYQFETSPVEDEEEGEIKTDTGGLLAQIENADLTYDALTEEKVKEIVEELAGVKEAPLPGKPIEVPLKEEYFNGRGDVIKEHPIMDKDEEIKPS